MQNNQLILQMMLEDMLKDIIVNEQVFKKDDKNEAQIDLLTLLEAVKVDSTQETKAQKVENEAVEEL